MIVVSPEVKHGLLERKPVVALESTIITHGMPFPANVELVKMFLILEFIQKY